MLKDGTILNKWSVNNLPDEYQLNAPLEKLPLGTLTVPNTWHKVMQVDEMAQAENELLNI